MQQIKEIRTIIRSSETKYKEKGSVFTGKVFHINSEKEAELILNDARKKFYDATHHCFALRLSAGSFKYSDDGEPNGTAGIRILNAIDHFDLTNLIVIVIRYFGGIKLGVGPLGKAYYTTALQLLQESQIITLKPYKKLFISAGFSHISSIHRVLSVHNAIIKNSVYDTTANFECLAEINKIQSISFELKDISKGEIEISEKDEVEFL